MSWNERLDYRWREASARLGGGRVLAPPSVIVLGVNNLCNLHCKMCDVGTGNENSVFYANLMASRPLNMPLELIDQVMRQVKVFSPRALVGYAFTEPLIYPHLEPSLRLAGELALRTSLTTNALHLERHAEMLCETGLDELFVSLDGPPPVHNEIRGHRRSFERAVAGIAKLTEFGGSGAPKVSVFCTLTQWNVGHLSAFLESLEGLDLQTIGFLHTNFTSQEMASEHNALYGGVLPATASNLDELDLTAIDVDELYDELRSLPGRTRSGVPVSFSPNLRDRDAVRAFYRPPHRPIGRICNDALRAIMVKSDGTVIPAHGRCFNTTLGSLHDSTLEEIWNGRQSRDFRRTLLRAGGLLPACARCCSAF